MQLIDTQMIRSLEDMKNKILLRMTSQSSTNEENYKCNICKDEEWILDKDTNMARPCKCQEKRRYEKIIENSGLSEAFRKRTFKNYDPNRLGNREAIKQAHMAKQKAMNYAANFLDLERTERNSMIITGQVGAGKTHLTVAVLNALMTDNIGVRYMEYVSEVKNLKQLAMDQAEYIREINKFKNARVLLVDDLLKKATYRNKYTRAVEANDVDIRIMYEIVNHRYLNQKATIFSSEFSIEQIIDFDEALGTRILEMSKGHIFKFKNKTSNFRIFGK